MKKLIKTLTLTAAGLVVGAVVIKRVIKEELHTKFKIINPDAKYL